MKDIHLRINEDTKATLERLAKEKDLSLNKYISNILEVHCMMPYVNTIEENYINLSEKITVILKETIDENTKLLKEVKYMMGYKGE